MRTATTSGVLDSADERDLPAVVSRVKEVTGARNVEVLTGAWTSDGPVELNAATQEALSGIVDWPVPITGRNAVQDVYLAILEGLAARRNPATA